MTFLLIASFPDSLLAFRGQLIAALQAHGLDVHIAAPDLPDGHAVRTELERRGARVHQIPLRRAGMAPLGELTTLLALWRLMRKLRPTYILGYTVKPVIYGALAGRFARVPYRFALITGLGYAFTTAGPPDGRRAFARRLILNLYAFALRDAQKVFFQNPDDCELFRSLKILTPAAHTCVVNGSGVDVAHYQVTALPRQPRFLLIARLLGDKGVREYVEAARRLKVTHPAVEFALAGWIDDNPDAISRTELNEWIAQGTIKYLGRLADVRPALEDCSVYVLPSYREGTPRTVLEAMAMGRAIITTDAPGCRETVVPGHNGFLVKVKSVDELQRAMLAFIEDPGLAGTMGARSREIAEDKYDVHRVNKRMLAEMSITNHSGKK